MSSVYVQAISQIAPIDLTDQKHLTMSTEPQKQRQGIQSIEFGARLLQVLTTHGRSMMLKDLTKNAGMPAAKAHRYLVSFARMGLAKQNSYTGR